MANFNVAVVTNAGIAADATALANGWTINITKAQVGQGILGSTDPQTLTNLISPVNLVAPAPNPPYANLIGVNNLVTYQVSVRWEVSSAWVSTQFQLTEAGLWASLHGGTEFLYAYCYTTTPDTITNSVSTSPVDNQYTFVIPYSQAPNITVSVGLYPTVNLHASTHITGGSNTDPIPISTTGSTGLLRALSGNVNDVLRGDGSWGAGFLPGMSINYRGLTAPSGWLVEDGSGVSTTTYSALFAVIGYTYGGSGGTFNLPDSRGRINLGQTSINNGAPPALGAGLSTRTMGQKAGSETVTLSTANMPSHSHGVTDNGHNHTINDNGHNHGLTDGGHSHGITQSAHGHGLVDQQHTNPLNSTQVGIQFTNGPDQCVRIWPYPVSHTYLALSNTSVAAGNANISINGSGANVSLSAAITGVFNSANTTGITIQANGSSTPTPLMNPFIVALKIIKT